MAQELCTICYKPASAPFRMYDERGKVVGGCIGEAHTGQLVTPSESARWHARPEAKKMRRERAAWLKGGVR